MGVPMMRVKEVPQRLHRHVVSVPCPFVQLLRWAVNAIVYYHEIHAPRDD